MRRTRNRAVAIAASKQNDLRARILMGSAPLVSLGASTPPYQPLITGSPRYTGGSSGDRAKPPNNENMSGHDLLHPWISRRRPIDRD